MANEKQGIIELRSSHSRLQKRSIGFMVEKQYSQQLDEVVLLLLLSLQVEIISS